jgi:hypothetical protein
MLDPLPEGAIFGFRRLFQTFAAPVIEPTMITASDAAVLDPTIF